MAVTLEGSGEIAEWDWITSSRSEYLHAPEDWHDPEYGAYDEHARTACGNRGWYSIPGLFSRMGAERCRRCCKARGYPTGTGSPKNDDECRPLVELRLGKACS